MDFVVAPRDGGQVAMQVAIRAAASGEVVYAGSGIGGYERLIIVKHTPELLSAYSFNGEIRVAERDRLNAGAPLAQMRSALRKPEKLHFELRRQGVPVNPRNVLK
jgi:lipoprotein NlpD